MTRELTVPVEVTTALVADAARGDLTALARLVASLHDDLTRAAFLVCGDLDVAADAVQATWVIAWRKLHTLRDPERLRPWLLTIVSNEARRLVRRQRRRTIVPIDVADVGTDASDPAHRAGNADLARALGRLSLDDRTLLALRHIGGYDATEIGRQLGISASGVRSRLARLTARLREELGDD